MIEFNKLLITPYNKAIYIDVSVLDMPYFKNVYIDKIIIDTQDTFNNNGPSSTPVYTYQVDGNIKNIQLTVNDTDILTSSMTGTMFFVYVITKGTPSSDVPCGLDNNSTLGVVVDTYHIYKRGLKFIQEAFDNCNIPQYFINFILQYKAFQMCLKTRDFPMAIMYWKKFWSDIVKHPNKCTCHG